MGISVDYAKKTTSTQGLTAQLARKTAELIINHTPLFKDMQTIFEAYRNIVNQQFNEFTKQDKVDLGAIAKLLNNKDEKFQQAIKRMEARAVVALDKFIEMFNAARKVHEKYRDMIQGFNDKVNDAKQYLEATTKSAASNTASATSSCLSSICTYVSSLWYGVGRGT